MENEIESKHSSDISHTSTADSSVENEGNVNDWQLDGTPLQKAINKDDTDMVRSLLEKGAKTYLPDEKYRLPIQVAAELKSQKTAVVLLENRSFVNKDYLNKIIEFCLEFYIGEEDFCKQDCGLLDFAASILTGKNINQLLQDKKNWIKYFGHLRQIKLPQDKDEVKETVKVEGWHQEEILAARIRILLEVIINLELNKVASIQTSWESEKELLMKEILLEIESLHICHAFSAIKKFSSELQLQKRELIESLATSILNGMKHFLKESYDEYCMPSGWPTHSIYINFMLFPDGYIAPRIDNLGPRPAKCHISEGSSPAKYYPAFIGKTKMNWQEEGENNKLKKYIINLITTKMYPSPYPSKQKVEAREVARDKAKKTIYDQDADQCFERLSKSKDHVQKMLKDLGYTPEHSQEGGTCVVTNHNIGLRIRLKTESLYQRVLDKESTHLGLITYYGQIDINRYWQEFLSPRQLPQRILQHCKRHYLSQTNITFLFPEYNLGQKKIEYIIPSLLKKEVKEIKENKKDKQKEGQSEKNRIKATEIYEKYLKQDHPIFVEGQAGMGKSTLCRYITSRWSEHKLWRGKFALVVYIRLRNLNTNRYPSHCHYDICDVVSKECLGGEKITKLEKKRFEEILNSKKVLWLLDGYDELPKLSRSLEKIVEEIFKKSQLIVTSRYPLPPHLTFDHCLEAAGFEEDDISKYIDNFYDKFEHREQLKDFLHNHHAVKLIASTPINLEIICSIWSSDKAQLIEASSLTTTNLYYIITLWILRRFLIRNGELLTQSSVLKETSKLRNDGRIFRRLHFELKSLEKIAFSMMQKFEYYLTQKDFFDLMPERQDKEFENDVVDIGILAPTLTSGMEIPEWKKLGAVKISNIAQPIKDDAKSIVTSVSPSKDPELIESTNYEFIHASFQEFFTALYLVDSLNCERHTVRYKEAVEFLTDKRYSSLLILEFTAGLLSLRKSSQKACDAFWFLLSQPPYDLTQFNQVGILINCLQQALSCGADIRQIDRSVIDYINSVLNSISRLNDRKNIKFDRLLRNIQSCDKVIAQPNLYPKRLEFRCFKLAQNHG